MSQDSQLKKVLSDNRKHLEFVPRPCLPPRFGLNLEPIYQSVEIKHHKGVMLLINTGQFKPTPPHVQFKPQTVN